MSDQIATLAEARAIHRRIADSPEYQYVNRFLIPGARLKRMAKGRIILGVPGRPLRHDELFEWEGELRPVYLKKLKPQTYRET